MGLGAAMLPEVLWSQAQQDGARRIAQAVLQNALALSGLTFPDDDQKAMLQATDQNLTRYEELRNVHIPNDISPPFYFSPLAPGMKVDRARRPLRFSRA
jgi:hypothetical protein